ncbi:glycosyltransferase family 4 protein [Flavobacterium luteum]|uniref:Glycosyltransferase family 4 protein n=1 Tax=Flavobacterium luteum TaxID=2026654 RepID=A0A7J5AE47_9FLAO|nr:glycosyltransferase family 4 protein [Flavobacterium luteum]KAB1155842.1 glycosyltransferase family 4 protein [Flavobacterium luteum]
MKEKIIRITTVPISLEKLLSGQLRFMSSFYDVIAVSSEKENLEKLGKAQEVPVFHLEMTRKITPIKDIIAVIKLFLFLKKTKPLIVHSHTPKAGIVGMLAAKLAGVPHRLHTVAGLPLLEVTGLKRKLLNVVEKFTYACANKVYPNSFGLRDIIIENNFCEPEKLKVLANGSSNGIDTSYFNSELFSVNQNLNLKNELGIHPDDFVFVFVGRLVRDKGINEMVLAFELLQKENAKIKLLLVGDYENDLDPLSSTTVNSINTNNSILAVGFKNDVRPYFAIANTLVFPSYREGFPNVVMQAGAMNLPCIVSNINGCNEIIIEKENGFIIPVKNDLAIFEAMKKILSNTLLTTKMKTNSRAMIVSRYEQKVVWDAILSEYRTFDPRI